MNRETGQPAKGEGNGGGFAAAVGDQISGKEANTGNEVSGKVAAKGRDGVTVLTDAGTTHYVAWDGLEEKKTKSKEWMEPEKFRASEWSKQWADPKAAPDDAGVQYLLESLGRDSGEIIQKIAETNEKLKGRPQTIQSYREPGTEGESARYTPERRKIHTRIMRKLLRPDKLRAAKPEPGEKPVFMILGGRGGSGKSWFKNNVYDPNKFIILDADAVKAEIPEFEGWNAYDVHEESSDILEQMLTKCIRRGLNIVLDGTMKTAASAIAKVLRTRAAGYRTEAHYMHLPPQEAAKRAIYRFRDGGPHKKGEKPAPYTGRYVGPNVVLANTTNENSFDTVKEYVDKWSFRDNNGKRGDQPVLISAGGKSVKKSFSAIVKFIAGLYDRDGG
jgi:predicted kinase